MCPIEKLLPADARQSGKLARASPLSGAKSRLSDLESIQAMVAGSFQFSMAGTMGLVNVAKGGAPP
jgi:hypothetical protein